MLLFQKVPEASSSKVGGAFGGLGGVNLGVSEVGQAFAIGCHPPCEKKEKRPIYKIFTHLIWLHLKAVENHLTLSDFSDH